jgi:large subunit ribosomal protein L15
MSTKKQPDSSAPKAPITSAPSGKTPSQSAMGVLSLSNLQPEFGSIRQADRVGRGRASGSGKTSGRGHNGEGQRSGNSSKRGFEGGQMPLYRRLPKFRSFPNPCKKQWVELNVGDLESLLTPEENQLGYVQLSQFGFWKSRTDGLRLLGNGEITRALNIQAHHVTPSAKAKIEAVGGKVELLEGPAVKFI